MTLDSSISSHASLNAEKGLGGKNEREEGKYDVIVSLRLSTPKALHHLLLDCLFLVFKALASFLFEKMVEWDC